MFLGHLALGYAAKRWLPHLSLAVLLAATQLADLLWPVLVAAGVEHVRIVPGFTASTPLEFLSYPYSHSLVALLVWGALFAWLFSPRRYSAAPFAVLLILVLSHWVLDVITHVPDMPVYPGSREYGLGLWNSVWATRLLELSMFAVGVTIYAGATAPRDAVGRWATWVLVAFLVVGFLSSSSPPPSVTALWITAMVLFVVILSVAHWSDRHRSPIVDRPSSIVHRRSSEPASPKPRSGGGG
jgi:hypothetical protein